MTGTAISGWFCQKSEDMWRNVLGKWKLTLGNKPLNAATALFTRDTGLYTQFTMRLARFQGTDKNEFIDNQRVEGNIFVLLNEAMNFSANT